MALVTRASDGSIDAVSGAYAPQISGLVAGEDLDHLAPCYIKSADGLVWMCNATAANEASEMAGFTPRAVKAGQPVTLFGLGTRMRYGTGLTPGNFFYLAATAGRLDTAATVGDNQGVAVVLTATDILILPPKVANPGIGAGIITEAMLAPNAMSGTIAKNLADAATTPGLPVLFRQDLPDSAGDVDIVLPAGMKIRVVDAWVVKIANAGGAANTVQVKNGATAITDAMSINIADKAIARAASIDDDQHEIAAAGTLRFTTVKAGGNAAAVAYVLAIRVA